jgi:D-amino-acid dehydrogenase
VKVVVMGAGLAGVTTAWYLARDGHEVVVIDREPEVAAAASYANTGIIAASRAYPWSAGEIGRAQRFDPELWIWLMHHLLLRGGRSYRRVLEAKVRLVRFSQQQLHQLIRDAGMPYEVRPGVLYLYREVEKLEQAWERAAVMRAAGFDIERLEPSGVATLEPALDA